MRAKQRHQFAPYLQPFFPTVFFPTVRGRYKRWVTKSVSSTIFVARHSFELA